MQKQSGIGSTVSAGKSFKVEYYQLAILNLTLLVAIYIKDLPVLYIIGSFILIRLTCSFVIYSFFKSEKVTDQNPPLFIQEQTRNHLLQLKRTTGENLRDAGSLVNGDNRINVLINVLVAIYFSLNFLPPGLQIILLLNFLFMWVFMRDTLNYCIERAKDLPRIWKA